ncbi:MAG: type IV pili twitching motility protein PilT, partial [Aquificaceae bacterium]|nr:type IV pili twitching motility protein PilT [Aquificaceae bacterium]
IELGASDVHIKTGSVPLVRVKKKGLFRLDEFPALDEKVMELIVRETIEKNRKKLAEFEEFGETDTSYSLPGVARFRVNVYKQRTLWVLLSELYPLIYLPLRA